MSQPIELDLKPPAMPAGDAESEPLVAVERRLNALYKKAAKSDSDDHISQIGWEVDDLEAEICQTVPTTLAGVAVKVRHLWDYAKEQAGAEGELNLRSLLEALDGLPAADGQAVELETPRPTSCGSRRGGVVLS